MELMTLTDAAEALGCTRQNVRKLQERGHLPEIVTDGWPSIHTDAAAVADLVRRAREGRGYVPDGYLTTREFARQRGVSLSTVRYWIENEYLPGELHEGLGVYIIPEAAAASFVRPKLGRPSEESR